MQTEGIHYEKVNLGWRCINCGKVMPFQYAAKREGLSGRAYGRDHLLRIWAWNNMINHLVACWRKARPAAEGSEL